MKKTINEQYGGWRSGHSPLLGDATDTGDPLTLRPERHVCYTHTHVLLRLMDSHSTISGGTYGGRWRGEIWAFHSVPPTYYLPLPPLRTPVDRPSVTTPY